MSGSLINVACIADPVPCHHQFSSPPTAPG